MKNLRILSTIALSLFTAAIAFAAPPPAANLEVMAWQGNTTPMVESPYQYTTRVKNIGNQTAQNVTITVEFPLTNTSPTRYILGKLTAVSASSGTCSTAGNKITCAVGSLSKNQIKSVTFTFEHQVATTAPFMRTTATTTNVNEVNATNNTLTLNPVVIYPDNIVTGGRYLVTSCSGTNLTSFYECERSPGSTQTYEIDLNPGNTLSIPQDPNYFGMWDQNTLLNKSLHFNVESGLGTEADFNGFASSGTCFKGITTFPQNNAYNSAYRVCLQ